MEAITIKFETYDTLFTNSFETNVSPIYTINPIIPTGKNGESLTSYLFRLANLHCVSVSNLIFYMIFQPNLKKEFSSNPYTIYSNINGYGKFPLLTLECLNELSEASISTKMTLDNFKDFYSRTNLLRKHKAWCKACLNEMKNKIIYEKLIWSISAYKMCISHQSILSDTCTKCGEKQKYNPIDGKNGYCQYCNIWLGEEDRNNRLSCELTKEDETYYKSKQIEDMLDYFYNEPAPIISNLASSFVKIKEKSKMNMSKPELCKYLGLTLPTFNVYCAGRNKFGLEKVLNVSWNLKISIIELMNNQDIKVSFNEKNFITRERKYGYQHINKEIYKQHLVDIIKSKNYIPIMEIAENLGTSPQTLKNRFPTQIKEIDDNNKTLEKTLGRKLLDRNYESDYTTIFNSLIEVIHSTELVSIRKITNKLNISTNLLKKKYPNIYEIIKLKNRLLINEGKGTFHPNLDYNYIESFLKEILITKKYITQNDICNHLNVSKDVLKRGFPNLMKEIMNNNKVHRIKNGKKLSEKGYKNNRQDIQKFLNEIQNSPELIRISQISKEIGISQYLLKRWFPELIESISYKNNELIKSKGLEHIDKKSTYRRFKQDELIAIEKRLIKYLNTITEIPIPQSKILKELGISFKIVKYFPEIFNEINTKNKEVKRRSQELLFRQKEAILRQTIISIKSRGMYPSIIQIELNANFKIRGKLDVSRRNIMEELGIEVKQFPH